MHKLLSLLNGGLGWRWEWGVIKDFFFQMNLPYINSFLICQSTDLFTNTQLFILFNPSLIPSSGFDYVLPFLYFKAYRSCCVWSLICRFLIFPICVQHDTLVPPQKWWRLNGHKHRTVVLYGKPSFHCSYCPIFLVVIAIMLQWLF